MPRRRRTALGRHTPRIARQSQARSQETEEQREQRLLHDRTARAAARARETDQQRQLRLASDAAQTARARATETMDHRMQRLQDLRAQRQRPNMQLNRVAFHYDPTVDYHLHPNVVIGAMDKVCRYCHALKYKNETPGMCCSSGKTVLPPLQVPPEPLLSLVSDTHPDSAHFLSNIRKYNSCFQMTSFGATKIHRENFMPTFRVQGQIYHQIGSLLPAPNDEYKYLQIYFMGDSDDDNQVQQRQNFNAGTNQRIVANLQVMLHENNHLVQLFKQAKDLLQNRSDNHRIAIHADRTPAGQHPGRFNAPTIDDVAILMMGDNAAQRDIVIYRRNETEGLQRISETHRSYDALQYPIIFPYGEDGYHFEMRQINPATSMHTH